MIPMHWRCRDYLSQAAAERLKMIQDGIVKVKIEVLDADRLR